MTKRLFLLSALLLIGYACTRLVDTPPTDTTTIAPIPRTVGTPEVLILGDSQISFGAGGAYTAFFSNLAHSCDALPASWSTARAAAIGVRSTALHHWTAANGPAKGTICDVDQKFGVNAGSYGVGAPGLRYVQIGADPDHPFCKAGITPLQAVFDTRTLNPDLLVLSFLGNATDRWQSALIAAQDWNRAAAEIPANLPCVAMTTIPTFERAENDRRTLAQANLARAVAAQGRCAFVPGFTPATRRAIEGNSAFFRTNDAGDVTDPRHPTSVSAVRFIDIQTPALCAAVRRVLTD